MPAARSPFPPDSMPVPAPEIRQGTAADSGADLMQNLVDSFRALLDEALIVAIANDYDLDDPSAYDAACYTLQDLARSVPSEEATGFNPSGIPVDNAEARDEPTASTSVSLPASQTHVTDTSTTDSSSGPAEAPYAAPRLTSLNNDSQESKMALLQSMFAELKEYDVRYALNKANGDFQVALDDLLNVQYLESTGQQMKGIDGLFKPDDARPENKRKKRKNKGNGGLDADVSRDVSRDGSPARGHGQDEMEWIAERFGTRSGEVSDLYRKNGWSKSGTVVELLDQLILHGIETQDEAGKQRADDLARRYRHVPEQYMATIVHVAGSIPQFADDLAALLNKHFCRQSKGQKLDLSYRLTPLPREDIEGEGQAAPGRTAAKPADGLAARPADLAQATEAASYHQQARRDALAAAAQLQRRGASSPLYSQAASFYKCRAREQARQAQEATSAAADMLVERQSTADSIDLHGILVQDGVRIAVQRTRNWWQGMGESRSRRAREGGFTVITGLGRHSASGVSQMRQAVTAALLQDGWKLRVETGKLIVTGRR